MDKYIIFCVVVCGLMFANHAIAEEKNSKPTVEAVKSVKPAVKVVPATKPVVKVVKSEKPAVKVIKPPVQTKANSMALRFARGLTNLTLCWLEIPRCMVYDNAVIPVFGLIVGIPEGAIYTTGRAISGVIDILSFTFAGSSLHNERFPEFIWDAKWMPDKK